MVTANSLFDGADYEDTLTLPRISKPALDARDRAVRSVMKARRSGSSYYGRVSSVSK